MLDYWIRMVALQRILNTYLECSMLLNTSKLETLSTLLYDKQEVDNSSAKT